MSLLNPALFESLETRCLLAASAGFTDQLKFAFPIGQADPVAMATDAQGNIYVAGHFEGTADFNPSRRRTFNLTAIGDAGDPFVAKYSPDGGLFWAVHVGLQGLTPGRRDLTANALTADRAGNVYLAGHFERTVDFDPGAGVSNLVAGANAGGDAFLLALDPAGRFRYANRLPTPGTRGPDGILSGIGAALATDAAGHVYLASRIKDQPDLAPDHTNTVLTKFSGRGRTLWVRHFAGTSATVTPGALAVDDAGNAFLAGHVEGTIDFDPGVAVHAVPNDSDYLLKLTADGDFSWLGSLGDSTTSALATDSAGNVYVGGGYEGTVDYNFSSRKTFTLNGAGNQDAFLARYSPGGSLAWARSMGGGGADGVSAVAIGADGLVYSAGRFSGRAYFNPGFSRFKLASQSASDGFFAAFDSAGVFQNATQIGVGASVLNALPGGGLVATGLLLGPSDVDPSSDVLTLNLVVPGQTNLFLLELI